MKISPSGNTPPMIADTGAQSTAQRDARQRAISMLSGPAQTETPVQANASSLSPEEFTAVVQQAKSLEQPVEEQEQTLETPEEVAPPKEDSYSTKLAALARREKSLRAEAQRREAAIKAKEEEILRREAELTGKYSNYETDYIPKSRLKESTYETLSEAGVDLNSFKTQLDVYDQVPLDPRIAAKMQALESTITRLEKAAEASQKAQAQATTDQYQAAIKQISNDVNSLVKSDPSYEAIRATKSQKDVVELIEETFKADGVVMSVEEAAKEVEEYLSEQLSNYANQIKKIRARIAPEPTKVSSPVQEQAQPKQPQMKTLTNANSTTRRLSARERAVAAFKGEKIG